MEPRLVGQAGYNTNLVPRCYIPKTLGSAQPFFGGRMRPLAAKIFWLVVLAALFLMPPGLRAQQQPPSPPPAPAKPEAAPEVPDLAELILRANKLSNRLAVLETRVSRGPNVEALE